MRQTKKEILEGIENISESKIINTNTVKYTKDDKIYIRLHLTDIITISNKYIILNSGGWKTPTTKDRMNTHQDICTITQDKSIWHVKTTTGQESVFYDGIKITTAGKIIKPKQADTRTPRLLKQINNYCKKLKGLKELPTPDAVDCWYCYFRTVKDGQPLGHAIKNTDHLTQHLKEKYIHGSLIFNALESNGHNNPAFVFIHGPRESITRAVKRYFKAQLGIAQ